MPDRLFLLPPDVAPSRVATVLGMLSDTHMPERLDRLEPGIFAALAGVDLLVHAGDVGELWVLDELSAIARVVAVHGNDDTAESQRELPFQQILVFRGRRYLLSHSHHPDRATELAQRVDDAMEPKLARLAARARASGADVFLFGHWHVPMVLERDGVLLVNAGAHASPNYTTRQLVRTVARVFVLDDGSARVVHVDVARPDRPYVPPTVPAEGFKANAVRYSESILEEGVSEAIARLRASLSEAERERIAPALLRAGRRVWYGERPLVTRADLAAELSADGLPL